MIKTYEKLLEIARKRTGFFCLIDPDKHSEGTAIDFALDCEESGADALLIGGSMMLHDNFESCLREIKKQVKIPLIIFPGLFNFVSPYADAILLLSMLSSRNPELLVGEQVRSAPLIKKYNLESIGTAYLLIESNSLTSVQYMSHSIPIPRKKIDIAVTHALAGQYLGMRMVYLEAGSGAKNSVPEEMITVVKNNIEIPLIVGGGIKTPEEAACKARAGADFVVIGTVFENTPDKALISEFAQAIQISKDGI